MSSLQDDPEVCFPSKSRIAGRHSGAVALLCLVVVAVVGRTGIAVMGRILGIG